MAGKQGTVWAEQESPWGWTMATQNPGLHFLNPSAVPTTCLNSCRSGADLPMPEYHYAQMCPDTRDAPPQPVPVRSCEYDAYRTVVPVHWSLGGGVVGVSSFQRHFMGGNPN